LKRGYLFSYTPRLRDSSEKPTARNERGLQPEIYFQFSSKTFVDLELKGNILCQEFIVVIIQVKIIWSVNSLFQKINKLLRRLILL